MELQNGYKIMYEAKERVSEEKPGPVYAGKGLPSLEDAMLISYNNGESYVDLKTFKLIYSDGKHLFGSVSRLPSPEDVNIVLKGNGEIILGEVIEIPVEEIPEEQLIEEPEEQKEPVVEEPVEEVIK